MALYFGVSGEPDEEAGSRAAGAPARSGSKATPILTAEGSPPGGLRDVPAGARPFRSRSRLFSVEEAVRKATSLPAQRVGLKKRGTLREGNHADVVIFDAATVDDRTTFREPSAAPTGIEHVLVNGTAIVRDCVVDTAARTDVSSARNPRCVILEPMTIRVSHQSGLDEEPHDVINSHTHMQRFEVDFPRELGEFYVNMFKGQDCWHNGKPWTPRTSASP